MAVNTSLRGLREAAARCTACDLYKHATQTVFGEGRSGAHIMLVGEQPGDSEDKEGHPFVGPAGKLLHAALHEAGIDERDVYITNAVKHFKFIERGKRRIHQQPKQIEIRACRPWLDGELAAVRPQALVALGATAARALLGSSFRLTAHRGEALASDLAPLVFATIHPSAILRSPDDATRHAERARFVDDLRVLAQALIRTRPRERAPA